MATPFEMVVLKMKELGFFQFLFPYMLSSAIFYGLLRKSQVFGDPDKNVSVNAVVALVASFMVWAYPILTGTDISVQLSAFFVQGMSATLIIMMGVMVAGMFFPPDLPKILNEKFKTGGFWSAVLVVGIIGGLVILVTSGLTTVFFPKGGPSVSEDTLLTVGVVIILIISTVAIVALGGGGKKT